MTTRQPKTEADVLAETANLILDKYFHNQKNICTYDKIELARMLGLAEDNKKSDYALFHFIKALRYVVLGNFNEAINSYEATLRIPNSHAGILSNYATTLIILGELEQAKEMLIKCLNETDDGVSNLEYFANIIELYLLSTLDETLLQHAGNMKDSTLDKYSNILKLKTDINKIDISIQDYQEFTGVLIKFIFDKTRQIYQPRFSIDNGLDRQLNIEAFLNINPEEASYLNTEFRNQYLDYIFDNERHDLLGKFVVFFRQNKNREDGTEKPKAFYLGTNRELEA
ncbi:hypothetical protein Psyc_2117 [Psychrobacter arcticus 273-4]|uniref:Uncharacterized protein n=1 Tax=Psychrobacter arcticus (strain DSM 17307 / VKM B-2377 / 273-4) TaxID=259536 RepID=Q4FPU4_PSYA2|nr:tetratricopeptide repeat protein [Psychrobacter arcticus]AAZ19964.1 hypothetical protein Psyc_2117 [Psychrobacter arcticus 273-4]